MGMVKHSQSFQNSKLAMSLHYLEKEVRGEIDFLYADKHQSFLQVDFNTLGFKVLLQSFLQGDTIIIDGYDQALSKYSK